MRQLDNLELLQIDMVSEDEDSVDSERQLGLCIDSRVNERDCVGVNRVYTRNLYGPYGLLRS